MTDKFTYWTNIAYGEIITSIDNPKAKNGILTAVHLILALAIFAPLFMAASRIGILCWALSSFYLLWNICLDQHSPKFLKPIRKMIVDWEKKAGIPEVKSNFQRFFFGYGRVTIPGAVTGVIFLIWLILLIL